MRRFACATVLFFAALPCLAQTKPTGEPLKEWVDPATGHRVRRLTDEANSTGFYFNVNAYTPDGKGMAYNAPDGIHVLDLATMKSRLLVGGGMHAAIVGPKTGNVYYVNPQEKALYVADVRSGESRKLAELPARGGIAAVNADETLAAGTFIEGDAGQDYGKNRVNPPGMAGPLVQPLNKGKMMDERLAAKLPMTLFVVDLKGGRSTPLLEHDTNWLNHLLFSPADPTLLMYCHEGPWHKVDRIWNIRSDGSHNELIHKRTMAMEIAGHEFWGLDGKTIWYDLQTPKGEDFFLAGYQLETGLRTWYHLQQDEWSIHFNVTRDAKLFCGDGGDPSQVAHATNGQWIYLFKPEMIADKGMIERGLVRPGVFRAERLVDMSKHNYKLEPNVRFSPDESMVIFTSNMFGPSYVFGVDVGR